jgi:hypothetical protein
MGPQTQFGVAAEGPVLDFETELKNVRGNDAVVAGADQPQGGAVLLQVLPQLLHCPWRSHFLELPAGG